MPAAAPSVLRHGQRLLTCDKFAADATFLPELKTQMAGTEQLIDQRRAAFQARTGAQMSQDNIWLTGRRQEHDALGRIIVKLERTRLAQGGQADAVTAPGASVSESSTR